MAYFGQVMSAAGRLVPTPPQRQGVAVSARRAHALVAPETGAVKSPDEVIPWDGPQPFPDWSGT
jgi:hypothetical protein